MIKETMEFLSQYDPEVGATIEKEYHREQRNIELIASENIVSPAVMMAMGTCLTNKYAEGYPGKRYYGGCYCVDETEEIARQRACKLFGAEHANVQPHSGASANLAAFKAMLQPGDTFMGMNLAHGGHLSHGSPVNISGQYFHQVPYSLNDETEMIDYDEVYRIAQECKPKMILAGASAIPARSTSPSSARLLIPSALSSWSIWPTSPVSSPLAFTRAPCPMPTLSPPPPTRPCAAPAAA